MNTVDNFLKKFKTRLGFEKWSQVSDVSQRTAESSTIQTPDLNFTDNVCKILENISQKSNRTELFYPQWRKVLV